MIFLYILLYFVIGAIIGGLFQTVIKPHEDEMSSFIAVHILLWPLMLAVVSFMLVWKLSNKYTSKFAEWITTQIDEDE